MGGGGEWQTLTASPAVFPRASQGLLAVKRDNEHSSGGLGRGHSRAQVVCPPARQPLLPIPWNRGHPPHPAPYPPRHVGPGPRLPGTSLFSLEGR